MREPYTIATLDKEFYSVHFDLCSEEFKDRIYLYAECSKNPDPRSNGYYFLELFFSVGAYGDREYWIGMPFGDTQMDKKTLDHEIRAYVISQLDNSFPELVSRYLQKEHLMENWLDKQYGQ